MFEYHRISSKACRLDLAVTIHESASSKVMTTGIPSQYYSQMDALKKSFTFR